MDNQLQEPAIAYNRHFTPEEYLNMEWENGQRYEYWEGNLFAMAGASMDHSKITGNLYYACRHKLKGKLCSIFNTDVKLNIKQQDKYFLPDLILTCNPEDLVSKKYIQHPSIIIEILSDSTEVYDRTQKWDEYRKIKSLRHYLLVSQHAYRVEMFSRTSEHGLFFQQIFEGLENIIPFRDIGFEVTLAEVYEGISFKEEEEKEGRGESS